MTEVQQHDIVDDEIDLVQLFGMFYARKFSIIAITFLATVIGVANALTTTPIYQADALILLEAKSGGGLALSSNISSFFGGSAPESVDEVEILQSRMILGTVVDKLNLTRSAQPKRLPYIGNFLTRYNLPDPGWDFISSYAWHDESITLGRLDIPEDLVGSVILTSLGDGTFSVDLGIGLLLNGRVGESLYDEATGFAVLVDTLTGAAGREFILSQISRAAYINSIRGNLSISEPEWNSSILELRLKNTQPELAAKILNQITQVYQLQNQSRSVAEIESSLDFLHQQLPKAQSVVTASENALNAFQISQQTVDLSFETLSMLERVVELEAQLNVLMMEEHELQKRFTQSHPVYQTLLDNRLQLEERLVDLRNQTLDLPEIQQEMLRLTQDLEISRQIYLQLVGRAQELNVIKAGAIGNIRIIDTAVAKPLPISPNKKMMVLLAMTLGLVVSLAYVLIRSFMTRTVKTVEEIEQLGIPVYATIAKIGNGAFGGAGRRKGSHEILAIKDSTNMAVEALRSLRTSLHFGMLDAHTSLCMITSSKPDEGKSFLSVNLAVVMAQSGQNVCLIDADIRRGYLARYFGLNKSAPGLTDVLAGDVMIEDVICKDEESGLFFIPSGKYPPNPSELLMHKRFAEVVDYLDKRFDLTILDTPPLLAVTDPVIVGKYAGMILLAVRHLSTNLTEVKAAQKVIETSRLKITGAVLNAYDAKKTAYGYGTASYQYEYKTRDA